MVSQPLGIAGDPLVQLCALFAPGCGQLAGCRQLFEHQPVTALALVDSEHQKDRRMERGGDGQRRDRKRCRLSTEVDRHRGFGAVGAIGQHRDHAALVERVGGLQHDLRAGLARIDDGVADGRIDLFEDLGDQRVLVAIHDHSQMAACLRGLARVNADRFEAAQVRAEQDTALAAAQGGAQRFGTLGADVEFGVATGQQQHAVDDGHGEGVDVRHDADKPLVRRLDPLEPAARCAPLLAAHEVEIQGGRHHGDAREAAPDVQDDPADQDQPEPVPAFRTLTPVRHGDIVRGRRVSRQRA